MVKKFFDWLRSKLFPEESKRISSPFDDREFQAIIHDRRERLKRAEKIVGKSPIEHIEYTIEHGLEEFNKAFSGESSESTVETEKEKPPEFSRTVVADSRVITLSMHNNSNGIRISGNTQHMFRVDSGHGLTVRGGIGNKIIHSEKLYDTYTKKYKEINS